MSTNPTIRKRRARPRLEAALRELEHLKFIYYWLLEKYIAVMEKYVAIREEELGIKR